MTQRIDPRAHQVEALETLRDTLAREDRAQAHMCCGSGKTFTQAFLARYILESTEHPSQAIIVCFVPNRTLIHQNARNFKLIFGASVDYLGVCSESDLKGLVAEKKTLNTTTQIETIQVFCAKTTKPRIIFSTYQSAPTLQQALALARPGYALTLGLFDEAHRTAGNKAIEDLFAFGLDDANFSIEKRGFFTATPRVVESNAQNVLSMSNPDLYGPVAYEYPFSQGIKDGNVVDYDLWVPIITRKDLADFMADQNLEASERAALAIIALQKVMQRTGQTRFLAYNSRISASKDFTKSLKKAFPTADTIAHVDGSTPGVEREKLMKALSTNTALLSNCKAFVEGVDAPGLQGVLFVDPRKSVVDVVQAVGRLSRPDPQDPEKRGSIIAPILVDSTDPAAITRAAKNSGFDTLVQVAQALRANDDALEEDILARARAIGRGDDTITPIHNMAVLCEDPSVDISILEQAITVATLNSLSDSFAETVGKLEAHIIKWGHLPTRNTDQRLYSWMLNTRKKHQKGTLEPVYATLLDDVDGWSWIGERTPPDTIAAHIDAFRDRTQRMPSGKRGKDAEADLHAYLMEAQEHYLQKGVRTPLTKAIYDKNLLFFAEEVLGKRAELSGYFNISSEPSPVITFHPRTDPKRKTIPVFRSGHTMPPRPIRIHAGRSERERLQALTQTHSARITLIRAGIEKEPLEDGRILSWHAGMVDRGETPELSTQSLRWLVNRLLDRKVSNRPAYTYENLENKFIKLKSSVTTLHPNAPAESVEHIMTLLDRTRQAAANHSLSDEQCKILDTTPGFSWIDGSLSDNQREALIARLVDRWGEDIINSTERDKDTGLGNTLKMLS